MKKAIVYLTDKNGGEMFKNYVGEAFIDSAKRDLQRHINLAKIHPKMYHFLDIETAKIEVKYENNKI
jgi:hypothetical protein